MEGYAYKKIELYLSFYPPPLYLLVVVRFERRELGHYYDESLSHKERSFRGTQRNQLLFNRLTGSK